MIKSDLKSNEISLHNNSASIKNSEKFIPNDFYFQGLISQEYQILSQKTNPELQKESINQEIQEELTNSELQKDFVSNAEIIEYYTILLPKENSDPEKNSVSNLGLTEKSVVLSKKATALIQENLLSDKTYTQSILNIQHNTLNSVLPIEKTEIIKEQQNNILLRSEFNNAKVENLIVNNGINNNKKQTINSLSLIDLTKDSIKTLESKILPNLINSRKAKFSAQHKDFNEMILNKNLRLNLDEKTYLNHNLNKILPNNLQLNKKNCIGAEATMLIKQHIFVNNTNTEVNFTIFVQNLKINSVDDNNNLQEEMPKINMLTYNQEQIKNYHPTSQQSLEIEFNSKEDLQTKLHEQIKKISNYLNENISKTHLEKMQINLVGTSWGIVQINFEILESHKKLKIYSKEPKIVSLIKNFYSNKSEKSIINCEIKEEN